MIFCDINFFSENIELKCLNPHSTSHILYSEKLFLLEIYLRTLKFKIQYGLVSELNCFHSFQQAFEQTQIARYLHNFDIHFDISTIIFPHCWETSSWVSEQTEGHLDWFAELGHHDLTYNTLSFMVAGYMRLNALYLVTLFFLMLMQFMNRPQIKSQWN